MLSFGAKFTVGNLKVLSCSVLRHSKCRSTLKNNPSAWRWHPRHEIKKTMSCSVLGPVHEGRCSKKTHLVLSVGAKFTVGNLKNPLMLSVTTQFVRVCDQKQSYRARCWHLEHEIKNKSCRAQCWACTRGSLLQRNHLVLSTGA